MPRQPKLGRKNGYWYTKAGNPNGVYFGRVGVVPYQEAMQQFTGYLKSLVRVRRDAGTGMTVLELTDRFLDWVKTRRSDRTYDERKRHLNRFNNFRTGSRLVAELPATSVEASHLESFLVHLRQAHDVDSFTADKHATSVKAAFNWGARHPSPTPHLPQSFRPFTSIEKYKRPLDPLLEGDLMTADEREALFQWADADLEVVRDNGSFRRRLPEEFRSAASNPYAGFGEVLRVYWHTGARTSELAGCRVKDFLRGSGQIVLGKHKRSGTMKDAVVRRITLNDWTVAVLEKRCEGRKPDDYIFLDPKGRPWTRYTLDERFSKVRQRAEVRKEITIYSFRHLWISEMLMSGADVATTAKMAGTSIAMIEKVYGHLTNDHFREAQKRLDLSRKKKARLIPAAP